MTFYGRLHHSQSRLPDPLQCGVSGFTFSIDLADCQVIELAQAMGTHLLCNSRPQAAGGDSASFVEFDGGYLLVNELCALLALQKPGLEDC